MLARMASDASKETARRETATRTEAGRGGPGVIAPPPAIYSVALAVALAAHWVWRPLSLGLGDFGVAAGALFVACGGALIRAAFRRMRRRETSPNPYRDSSVVVSDGVFGFCRNPIYLGMTVAMVGFAWVFDTAWILIALVGVLPVMHWGVIRREEKYLARAFGAPYVRYLATVRRWI